MTTELAHLTIDQPDNSRTTDSIVALDLLCSGLHPERAQHHTAV